MNLRLESGQAQTSVKLTVWLHWPVAALSKRRLWVLQRRSYLDRGYRLSDLRLLRHFQCVIDLNT